VTGPLFPFFGGKRRAAEDVWRALGDADLYLEPFAGSLAVLFNRPTQPRAEVVVDSDGFVVNFWRCLRHDPHGLLSAAAVYVGGPVAEVEVTAWQRRLHDEADTLTLALRGSVEWCDLELAALWWAGVSSWLGSPTFPGHRVRYQRPHIDRSLKGLYSAGVTDQRVLSAAARLSNVILLAGDWQDAWRRAVTTSILNRWRRGTVGTFLDPPYAKVTAGSPRAPRLYRDEWTAEMSLGVRAWAIEHGEAENHRIVLAGYDDDEPIDGWVAHDWRTPNGYAQASNERRHADVLWFSPAAERQWYHHPPGVHPNQETLLQEAVS
jgi:site-specific DNA-adenine methylase